MPGFPRPGAAKTGAREPALAAAGGRALPPTGFLSGKGEAACLLGGEGLLNSRRDRRGDGGRQLEGAGELFGAHGSKGGEASGPLHHARCPRLPYPPDRFEGLEGEVLRAQALVETGCEAVGLVAYMLQELEGG